MESREAEDQLVEEIKGICNLLYWARTDVHLAGL